MGVLIGVSAANARGVCRLLFFIHKDSGELHPDTENLMEKVAQKIEQGGVEAWFDTLPKPLLVTMPQPIKNPPTP